jgi:hypothetical protein
MKKIILFIFAVAVTGIIATVPTTNTKSNIAQPPAGHTGAPGETTCNTSNCHVGNSVIFNDASISLTASGGSLSNGYTANQTYSFFVTLGNGFNRYGFQVVALNDNNNQAGSFTITNTNGTALATANGKQYVSHKNASSGNAFAFNWTAPASGNVNFYLVVNTANDDNTNGGDQIRQKAYKLTTSSFAPFTYSVGIGEVKDAAEAGITLFPNPVSDVLNISYTVSDATIQADIYNLNGQLVKPLFEEQASGHATHSISMNNELATGIYLVKFNVGEQVYFKKILVQQ